MLNQPMSSPQMMRMFGFFARPLPFAAPPPFRPVVRFAICAISARGLRRRPAAMRRPALYSSDIAGCPTGECDDHWTKCAWLVVGGGVCGSLLPPLAAHRHRLLLT